MLHTKLKIQEVGQIPVRNKSEPACFDLSESFRVSGELGVGTRKARFKILISFKKKKLLILFISTKGFSLKAKFYFSNKYVA